MGAVAVATLTACELFMPPAPPDEPAPEPEVAAPAAPERSAESLELEDYYARVQERLLTRGLLRRDGGGPDTPFDADTLTENFVRIALFNEFTDTGRRLVQTSTPSGLHRWPGPVTLELRIGAAVAPEDAERDRTAVAGYARRLSRIGGLTVRTVPRDGAFKVFIVTEDERRALGPAIARIAPGISDAAMSTLRDLPRDDYCIVFTTDGARRGEIAQAIAIIRAEHPDLHRLSCLHEEIAQGLGLPNDSARARPSIFNDDEEFGLLTTHDEMLLAILYDPRLRPGMTEAEARPIVRQIAEELVGGES